jgi:hypothetical protein
MDEKPGQRAGMADIIDAVMLNTEYEAGIKVHRGREIKMSEEPEIRDGMFKTNPKGKHDENVNVTNVMDENNAAAPIEDLQLYTDSYYQYSTSKAASGITNNIQDKRARIEVAKLLWVPGGKQVANVLTKEVSSNLVERSKQGKVWWRN